MPTSAAVQVEPRPHPAVPAAAPICDAGTIRLEGEYWTIHYDGLVVRLRDVVGMRHLAQLLWYPGREFHALDLMRALALAGATRGGRPAAAGAPGIDGDAAVEYRRRVRELEQDLVDAQAWNDLGRAGAIRHELDALLRELDRGARGWRLDAAAERARLAVTKALKTALARIRAVHPALASHLDATVRRGYLCVYRPDPRCPMRWDA